MFLTTSEPNSHICAPSVRHSTSHPSFNMQNPAFIQTNSSLCSSTLPDPKHPHPHHYDHHHHQTGASGPAFPSIHGRQLSRNATAGGGGGASTMSPRLDVPNHRGAKETENRSGYLWRAPGAARARPSVLEGWMKKRGGTINHWADRLVLDSSAVVRKRTTTAPRRTLLFRDLTVIYSEPRY